MRLIVVLFPFIPNRRELDDFLEIFNLRPSQKGARAICTTKELFRPRSKQYLELLADARYFDYEEEMELSQEQFMAKCKKTYYVVPQYVKEADSNEET